MRLIQSMNKKRGIRSLLLGGVCAGLLVCSSASAQGVNRDVTMAIEQARGKLQAGQSEEAVSILLELFSASEPTTAAQRQPLVPEAIELLNAAQAQLAAAGRQEAAMAAADAAWALNGRRPQPQYALQLSGLAEQNEKSARAQSLYFARRALLVDPSNSAAQGIDRRLSVNRFKWPGLGVLIGGAVVAAVGLGTAAYGYTKSDTVGAFGTNKPLVGGLIVAVVGGLAAGTGGILLGIGAPVDAPVSPDYLPALPE